MVKFLIIRFSSIGDIVLTTPLVRCLKTQMNDVEIHYLVKPAFKEILLSNPYISKVHLLANNLNDTVEGLVQENYDYVIDLQNNVRSGNIKRSLKRMYFTIDKLNLKKWLLVNLKINRLPDLHIVDRYMETAKLFDIHNDNEGLDYFIPEDQKLNLTVLPKHYHSGYIALVIGANHYTKKMPGEKIIELTEKLDYPIILIGGEVDKEIGDKIVNTLPAKQIFNSCGQYSINTSASIIEQSKCVITHDTGMMHIAAAFKKRIITIWGNTLPNFGMYAYQADPASIDFEVSGLKCRPCSKLGKKTCPKKHFRCMNEQDTKLIALRTGHLYNAD